MNFFRSKPSGTGVRNRGHAFTGAVAPLVVTHRVHQRGICENAETFGVLGGGLSSLSQLVFRNIDVPPFTTARRDAEEFGLKEFYAIVLFCTSRAPSRPSRLLLSIAEGLMPNMPQDRFLITAESRRVFVQIMRDTWPEHKANARAWLADAKANRFAANDHIINGTYDLGARVTPDFLMEVLMVEASLIDEGERRKCSSIIVLLIVSMAWRGNCTPARLNKFMGEMDVVAPGLGALIDRDNIRLVFSNFGPYLTDGNVEEVVNRWMTFIPGSAVRCRVILQQSAGSGMTSLDVIAKAIHEHPSFPWTNLGRLYPGEWINALTALEAVGANHWYGFRSDLGPVRSTQYRNISWVCKELLIRSGSDPHLQNKAGWITTPKNHIQVEGMIVDHLKKGDTLVDLVTPPTDEEDREITTLLQRVSIYPVNAGWTHVPVAGRGRGRQMGGAGGGGGQGGGGGGGGNQGGGGGGGGNQGGGGGGQGGQGGPGGQGRGNGGGGSGQGGSSGPGAGSQSGAGGSGSGSSGAGGRGRGSGRGRGRGRGAPYGGGEGDDDQVQVGAYGGRGDDDDQGGDGDDNGEDDSDSSDGNGGGVSDADTIQEGGD
ncbi:hypothetical protein [Sanxia atyid shrimp virus 4]|uniref:Uncharacterized protein n=1 Tax=Sanxia atyid shrimp virus 4 TaxID=1923358 RepID=A0A1L3KN13_9VIRU|nr:hypothetical protein [Sanxia atyid shrimp virus 4]APG78772.1 hypothetical protein [Sanxia atyid shrimp virus 4]